MLFAGPGGPPRMRGPGPDQMGGPRGPPRQPFPGDQHMRGPPPGGMGPPGMGPPRGPHPRGPGPMGPPHNQGPRGMGPDGMGPPGKHNSKVSLLFSRSASANLYWQYIHQVTPYFHCLYRFGGIFQLLKYDQ